MILVLYALQTVFKSASNHFNVEGMYLCCQRIAVVLPAYVCCWCGLKDPDMAYASTLASSARVDDQQGDDRGDGQKKHIVNTLDGAS